MTMLKPSPRQADTLAYVADYILRRGIAPTVREIAEGIGVSSTNGVIDHLRALARKRYIMQSTGYPRDIQILVWPPADLSAYGPETHIQRMRQMLAVAEGPRTCGVCAERALSLGTLPRCRRHENK